MHSRGRGRSGHGRRSHRSGFSCRLSRRKARGRQFSLLDERARRIFRADPAVEADGGIAIRDTDLQRLQIVAHTLAKSVVLAQYELRVKEVFEQVEPLAEALHKGRGSGARGPALLRQIGSVLLTQARTVGRIEVTEKPELTWEQPALERLYARLGEEYELRERDVALGRKLEVISRTAQTFLDLLYNRRSLRVEWYIVILILLEIALTLYELFVHR